MKFNRARDLMLAHVLGDTSPRESAELEKWIASGDPVAAAVLAEAEAIAAQIADAVEPVAPSPEMWTKLDTAAQPRARRALGPLPEQAPLPEQVPLPDEAPPFNDATPDVTRAKAAPRPRLNSKTRRSLFPTLAAAAAAALVSAAATWFLLSDTIEQRATEAATLRLEMQQRIEQVQELRDRVRQREQELVPLRREVGNRVDQIARLEAEAEALRREQRDAEAALQTQLAELQTQLDRVTDPDATAIALVGSDARPGAAGRAFWNVDDGTLVLSVAGLAPPTPQQTYQAWFVRDPGGPVSLGLVDVGDDGAVRFSATVDDAIDASAVAAVALSLEPAGGSPTPNSPSGPVVVVGTP